MKVTSLVGKIRQLNRSRTIQTESPSDWTRWIALISVFFLTVILTTPVIWEERLPKTPGEVIDTPIIAEYSFGYFPPNAEQEYLQKREREHTRVFNYDSGVVERVSREVSDALNIGEKWALENLTANDAQKMFIEMGQKPGLWDSEEFELLGVVLRDDQFQQLAPIIIDDVYNKALMIQKRDRLRYDVVKNNRRIVSLQRPPLPSAETIDYPDHVSIRLRNAIRNRLGSVLRKSMGEATEQDILKTPIGEVTERFFTSYILPNFFFDLEATELNEDNFPPLAPTNISKGAILAPSQITKSLSEQIAPDRNDFPYSINEEEARLISTYSTRVYKANIARFIAQVLFVLIAFSIVSFFVIKFSRELPFSANTVWLLGLPVLLALGLGRFILFIGDGTGFAGYAFPAGVIGILGVLLLDVRLAILLVTWGCLLFGLEANLEYEFVIVGLFGGYTAVAALYNIRERRDVLVAGLLIGFVNAASILIINFINDQPTFNILSAALLGGLTGVLSSLISFAVLPVFEVLFNITTDLRLLELSGLQHPLIKRMEEEAPGTLQHTLNVSKLAEAAAQQIGVNYLLIRAGVYFHDIGKMAKPEYFTENQLTAEDKKRHNELRPQMSTLSIRNHVKEGLEMAEEYKLPRVIRQFISEHHGTTLIKYFYYKAREAYEDGKIKEPISEAEYRYPGPRPQSIESAVVMLADTVEAIATAKLSGREVREDDIQKLVRDAIFDKFNDGQFNECNLTMRDLDIIRESFVKTLRSRFHSRIDYPSAKKNQPEKKRTRDEETGAVNTQRDSQASKDNNPTDSEVKEPTAAGS